MHFTAGEDIVCARRFQRWKGSNFSFCSPRTLRLSSKLEVYELLFIRDWAFRTVLQSAHIIIQLVAERKCWSCLWLRGDKWTTSACGRAEPKQNLRGPGTWQRSEEGYQGWLMKPRDANSPHPSLPERLELSEAGKRRWRGQSEKSVEWHLSTNYLPCGRAHQQDAIAQHCLVLFVILMQKLSVCIIAIRHVFSIFFF